MPPVTLAEALHSNGVDFTHIGMSNLHVTVSENGGGFAESFGAYTRTASLCQAARQGLMTAERSDVERYERWAAASNIYRQWSADQLHPMVRRASPSRTGWPKRWSPRRLRHPPECRSRKSGTRPVSGTSPFSRCKVVPVTSNAGFMPYIAEQSRADYPMGRPAFLLGSRGAAAPEDLAEARERAIPAQETDGAGPRVGGPPPIGASSTASSRKQFQRSSCSRLTMC